MMIYLLTFLTALLISAGLTPLAMRLGVRLGMVDRPGGRRRHRGEVARTGGLALFGGFTLTVLLMLILPRILPPEWAAWFPPREDPKEMQRLIALLAGGVFCAVAGFLDDRYQWSSGPQYLVQVGAALIAMAGLIFLKHVNNPFAPGFFFGEDGIGEPGLGLAAEHMYLPGLGVDAAGRAGGQVEQGQDLLARHRGGQETADGAAAADGVGNGGGDVAQGG